MYRRTRKGITDKRNCHGAVGKSYSEQHFSPTPSATGSYSWQADEIQVNFEIFKVKIFDLSLHLTIITTISMHSSWFFQVRPIQVDF